MIPSYVQAFVRSRVVGAARWLIGPGGERRNIGEWGVTRTVADAIRARSDVLSPSRARYQWR